MNVREILKAKGALVVTVRVEASIDEVARVIAERAVGAAVVLAGDGRVAGILSERDIVRGLAAHGARLGSMLASDLMTREVVFCGPDDEVGELMATMTGRRVRHLPVLADGALAGIVSIGDVVKSRLDEVNYEASAMREYITAAR